MNQHGNISTIEYSNRRIILFALYSRMESLDQSIFFPSNSRTGSFTVTSRPQKMRPLIYVSTCRIRMLWQPSFPEITRVFDHFQSWWYLTEIHMEETKQDFISAARESFIDTKLPPCPPFPCYCIGHECFSNGYHDGLKQGFTEFQ